MRLALVSVFAVIMIGPIGAQQPKKKGWDPSIVRFWHPFPHSEYVPPDDLKKKGALFRLEVLASLKVWDAIDTDPKVLEVYTKHSGVEVGMRDGFVSLIRGFELYLGRDAELVKSAKELDGKWVIVEGDLAIVHGPVQTLFGTGLEGVNMTEHFHAPPRYVINVRRLNAAPAGVPNVKNAPYIKIEVKGILSSLGKNPSLKDISDGNAGPSTVIRTDQCNLFLFLGKDDKWLARAKELNGKLAVAKGELISVGRNVPGPNPLTQIVPLPYYMLDVSDLKEAPKPDEKKVKK